MEAEAPLFATLTPLLAVVSPHGGVLRPAAAYLAFAQESPFHHYLRMQYADQTFKGLYHWNFFDAAVLLPYFAVMILLSLYGIHRYTMAYQYFKYRRNYKPNPPKPFVELPLVTVQLPIFNEQFVIDRLIEAVCAMEYPPEKLEIQVLDDSTDETCEVPRLSSTVTLPWGTTSFISTAPTGMATRPGPSTPDSNWRRANSWPSSTPTLFRRPNG